MFRRCNCFRLRKKGRDKEKKSPTSSTESLQPAPDDKQIPAVEEEQATSLKPIKRSLPPTVNISESDLSSRSPALSTQVNDPDLLANISFYMVSVEAELFCVLLNKGQRGESSSCIDQRGVWRKEEGEGRRVERTVPAVPAASSSTYLLGCTILARRLQCQTCLKGFELDAELEAYIEMKLEFEPTSELLRVTFVLLGWETNQG
ncbi:hypothetical protein Bbelb_015130 [Branchiostoma belcheri]|nr:hypothetical protein Bbelb_015130 [Branchiostoma belcheri]